MALSRGLFRLVVVADQIEEAVLVEDGDVEFLGFGKDVLIGGQFCFSGGTFLDGDGVFFVFGREIGDNGLFTENHEIGVDVDLVLELAAPLADEALDDFGVFGGGDAVLIQVECSVDDVVAGDAKNDAVGGAENGFVGADALAGEAGTNVGQLLLKPVGLGILGTQGGVERVDLFLGGRALFLTVGFDGADVGLLGGT